CTYRGTRDGVPRLMALLKQHRAGATFLYSLGPDRTGRAIGALPRVPRLRCYGPAPLLSGTLLPALDIGARCAGVMRAGRDEGFEAGIHADDRAGWMLDAAGASEAWTVSAMQRARERYEEIFGKPALTHGAAGWRMNRHAWRQTQRLGFRHCSDTRGHCPFVPILNGEIIACPQLPTTLPTLDELLARDGMAPDAVSRRLLELSRHPPATGHVYTLRAEIEGGRYAPVLGELLAGWRAQGYDLISLRDYAAELDLAHLPRHGVVLNPGTSGTFCMQGNEFLA
ncbi:MAG: 4-deoxy-4-formamido-L-arabinose-phosphoundecaprenol deformylase, partial [Betaproteobacteria bacterium]|nr:4-deoxy-4-formamido-L-arabinose-phosphoundecaprenol deformylase [Betaproteobacteria bacterium]